MRCNPDKVLGRHHQYRILLIQFALHCPYDTTPAPLHSVDCHTTPIPKSEHRTIAMRYRQVACLGSCVYSLPCTFTYTSRFTPDMLVCLRVLGTAVLWGRPWGWGARAGAAARPPVACTSVGCRGPGGCFGARGLAGCAPRLLGGSGARLFRAHACRSPQRQCGAGHTTWFSTSANPGFITRTAILLRPAGYFVIHRSGSWRES